MGREDDIVPELLEKIRKEFHENFSKSEKIKALEAKVRDGTATYIEAQRYAEETGNILAQVFKKHITEEALPDGRMYYNIAQRILQPTLGENHKLITDITTQVQNALNKKAGLGIKAIVPELNQDRVDGLVNHLDHAETFEEVARTLDEPIKQHAMSVVSDAIEANAKFQHDAGLQPKIVRKAESKCCEWCSGLAKTYLYPDEVPKDVYRRHDRCRCTVDYVVGKSRRNVHGGVKKKVAQQQQTTSQNAIIAKQSRVEKSKKAVAMEKAQKDAAEFIRKFKAKAVKANLVVDVMRKDARKWIESLNDEELRCIRKYTFNGNEKRPKFYERLNAMLRGEIEEDDNLRYYTEVISNALKRSELGENIICFRGIDVNPVGMAIVGDVVNFKQFTSSSVIESKTFDYGVKMIIYAKKGCKGAYIESISLKGKQREVLFDKDCWYRVLSNQGNVIELEVL